MLYNILSKEIGQVQWNTTFFLLLVIVVIVTGLALLVTIIKNRPQ